MSTATITRPVTRTVTENVTTPVVVTSAPNRSGGVKILLNGEHALTITSTGYLRRMRGLTENVGVRLLDDGRIAIKAQDDAASA